MSANSVNSSQRRCSRRVVRDPARRKAVLILDLNYPPPSHHASLNALVAAAAEVAEASSLAPASGGVVAPIDVEAIDDGIEFLSSSRGFHEQRNQSRRKNRVILVTDEEQDVHSWRSVTSLHPNHSNKRVRIPLDRTIINCESYTSSESTKAVPVPKKAKVPTFSCPICMDKLVDPCSTVCGHIFCQDCLKNAVRSQNKCPTCRTKMTSKSFHRVFLPNALLPTEGDIEDFEGYF